MLLGVNGNSCYSMESDYDGKSYNNNINMEQYDIHKLRLQFINTTRNFYNDFPSGANNTLTNLMNNDKISENFTICIRKFLDEVRLYTIWICDYLDHNKNNSEILAKLYLNMIQLIRNLQNNIEIKINNTPNNTSNMAELEDYIIEGVSNLYKIMNKLANSVKDNLSTYNLSDRMKDHEISYIMELANKVLDLEENLIQLRLETVISHCLSNCDSTLKQIKLDQKTGNMTEENDSYNFMDDFDKIIQCFYNGITEICEKYNIRFINELVNIIETFWKYQYSFCNYLENLPNIINDYSSLDDNKENDKQKIQKVLNKYLNKFAIHSITTLKNILEGCVSCFINKDNKFYRTISQNGLKNMISEIVKVMIPGMISYIDEKKEILQQVSNDIPLMLACIYPNSEEDRKLQNKELNSAIVHLNEELHNIKLELKTKLTLLNNGV